MAPLRLFSHALQFHEFLREKVSSTHESKISSTFFGNILPNYVKEGRVCNGASGGGGNLQLPLVS